MSYKLHPDIFFYRQKKNFPPFVLRAMTIVFISNVFEEREMNNKKKKNDEDRRVVFKFHRDR